MEVHESFFEKNVSAEFRFIYEMFTTTIQLLRPRFYFVHTVVTIILFYSRYVGCCLYIQYRIFLILLKEELISSFDHSSRRWVRSKNVCCNQVCQDLIVDMFVIDGCHL